MTPSKILWADADGLCLFTKRPEKASLSGLRYVTARYPLPRLATGNASSISWTGRQPKTSSRNSLTML
ncbi:hypothetical protein H3U44_23215 [Escherichia coli]|nr:hypothetical protein [Escherichia coli]